MEIKLDLVEPIEVCSKLGTLIRLARQREELTQGELSRKSGVPTTTISRMERDGQVGFEAITKVMFALDLLDVLDGFLNERLRIARFPKHLDEETKKVPLRVRHRKEVK